jgi:diguanylate cyclase (GGDEF)-like protein
MAAPNPPGPPERIRQDSATERLDHVGLRLRQFPRLVAAICVVAGIVVGLADYSAGPATSLAVFYLLPVMFAAFVFGRAAGLAMAGFVAAVNVVADWLQFGVSGIPQSLALWNGFSRLPISVLVAVLLSALRQQWRNERLVARIDVTTGVANARALFERLEESLAASRRNDFPLSLCLFDVDDFKAVNDAYGHPTGDRLLRDVAQAAGGALRPGDTVARWGGDEFVLVLPGADAGDARAAVDRLVETLEAAAARGGVPVTLSVGVVTTPPTMLASDELLKRADELMYEAKRAGKNRTVCGTIVREVTGADSKAG